MRNLSFQYPIIISPCDEERFVARLVRRGKWSRAVDGEYSVGLTFTPEPRESGSMVLRYPVTIHPCDQRVAVACLKVRTYALFFCGL